METNVGFLYAKYGPNVQMNVLLCSHGYAPFFQAIQPQLNSLRTFLLQHSKSLSKLVTASMASVAQQAASASPILPPSSRKSTLDSVGSAGKNPVYDAMLSH